ncbi:MAG TPA: heavy metal-binding domain-containing protein, partial [Flavisolibacter sp.]
MKQLFMILGAAILLYACTGSKISDHAQHSTHQQHETGYSCPMHPEVTGREGDRCEKCGMKLEPTAAPPAVVPSFFMEFVMQPQVAEPGQDVELFFTPKQKEAANKQVPLEVEHEKKIHLILVNNDLSWFDHIHPEYTPGGTYKVTERFPAAGT